MRTKIHTRTRMPRMTLTHVVFSATQRASTEPHWRSMTITPRNRKWYHPNELVPYARKPSPAFTPRSVISPTCIEVPNLREDRVPNAAKCTPVLDSARIGIETIAACGNDASNVLRPQTTTMTVRQRQRICSKTRPRSGRIVSDSTERRNSAAPFVTRSFLSKALGRNITTPVMVHE